MNGRERILALLEGRPIDRLPLMPITMMFAADRIGAKYLDYSTNYRIQVEGQIRVAEDFEFDYVNTMSDPACEAADCGASVRFFPNQPAALDEQNSLLADKSKLLNLKVPDPASEGRMHNRLQAIALFKEKVGRDKLVEGWIEGPCAEGADLRGINTLMLDFYDDSNFVCDLFEYILEMELKFAKEQAAAGADQIGIGDAAASLVGPEIYEDLIWPYEKRMVDGVHELGMKARLHICGDTRPLLEGMGKLGCDIVDLDFISPMAMGRRQMGPKQVLLGNIDPVRVLRNGDPISVYEAIAECHRDSGNPYIVGAGCEVVLDTPPENLKSLTRYAKEHH